MFAILSTLTPSIIIMRLDDFFTKKKEKDLNKKITNFIMLVLLINIITCVILIKGFNAEWVRYKLLENLNTFAIYMMFYNVVSILVGIALLIVKFIFRNVEFDFETKSKKNNI